MGDEHTVKTTRNGLIFSAAKRIPNLGRGLPGQKLHITPRFLVGTPRHSANHQDGAWKRSVLSIAPPEFCLFRRGTT